MASVHKPYLHSLTIGKRISTYCSLISDPCYPEQFITNSLFPLLILQRNWTRSVGNDQLSFPSTRANTLFRLSPRENPELYRSSNIFYEFESIGCYFLPAWYFRKSLGTNNQMETWKRPVILALLKGSEYFKAIKLAEGDNRNDTDWK